MSETHEPLRADARRNRERIVTAAGELFARYGRDAQMEQIAAHSGLGMGTLYRHFPNKRALLTAIVQERFQNMTGLARVAEQIEDPLEAFETVFRSHLEAADGDAAFQLAMLGSDLEWEGVKEQKAAFGEVVARIIDRAVAAGVVRGDLAWDDFPVLANGVMATMYFRPGDNPDWRRHLELVLGGVRAVIPREPDGPTPG